MPEQSRIASYEPEELLASVGLVDTYRARLRGEDGEVALKVLFLDRAEASVARSLADRFLAAGRRAQAATGVGTAPILEVAEDGDTVFVASEFVSGFDLGRLVQLAGERPEARRPGLPPEMAGLLCAQVARALAAAHALGPPLHHLGLSPANVAVTAAGQVRVLDFGLGAALRASGSSPIEKWQFVAPELIGVDAAGIPVEAARAADLYSLGSLLFFLLCGRPPVAATTLADLSDKAWEPLPDIAGIPNNLRSAMRTLTAPEPSDRPDSASIVVEWLTGGATAMADVQVAKALQALKLQPASPSRPAAPAKPPARSLVFARPKTAAAPAAPQRREGASASRPVPRRWLSQALVSALVLLACVLVGWGVARRHTSSRPLRPADAGAPVPAAIDPELASAGRGAVTPSHPPDGGLHPSSPEVKAEVERYQPKDEVTPTRIPNHLFLDTSPSQADVWVDGTLRGKTPVDLVAGPGSHRVVVIRAGYLMIQAVFDTTLGAYARRGLQRASPPHFGDAFLDVQCGIPNRYPVLLDDEETGLICPVSMLPVTSGKHTVGIFVPARRASASVEVTVPSGRQPKRVLLRE